MTRLSVLLAFVPAFALAAPVPKGVKKDGLYHPVTVGTKRVMHTQGGNAASEVTETVAEVEEQDEVYTVTMQDEQGGKKTYAHVFEVSAKGVSRPNMSGVEIKPSHQELNLEVKAGDTWTTNIEFFRVKETHTMGKAEQVETPAGAFTALRVESVSDDGSVKTTSWDAAGVGLVKREIDRGGRKTVRELKEFIPGKEGKEEPKKEK